MKSWKLVFFLTLAVSLMASTGFGAAGSLLVDEDFEDAEPFTELNWPIFDIITPAISGEPRTPIPAEVAAWQGYEVRADEKGSTKPMTRPYFDGTSFANPATGINLASASEVPNVSDRFFTGSDSLVIYSNSTTPSTTVKSPGNPPGQSPEIWGTFQVAVSFDANDSDNVDPTLRTPWPAVGTRVGRVRWKTRVRTEVAQKPWRPNASYVNKDFDVDFVVNSSTTIDIIAIAPTIPIEETKIGELKGGVGEWAVISILQQGFMEVPNEEDGITTGTPTRREWVCYDMMDQTNGRNVYIGPQPYAAWHFSEGEFTSSELAHYPRLTSGVHIFCNSDTPAVSYLPLEIHNGIDDAIWGAWGTGADPAASAHGTLIDGYEISATSGEANMYIDDLYLGVGASDNPRAGDNGLTLATAARLQPFTGVIDPTWGVTVETPQLAVRDWAIYE